MVKSDCPRDGISQFENDNSWRFSRKEYSSFWGFDVLNIRFWNGHQTSASDLRHQLTNSHIVIPFRWMAPESLSDFKFSTKSDVWSFGVVVWEIFSLGNSPWCEILTWSPDFVKHIENGTRLPKPYLASQDLYDGFLMKCWEFKPEQRPSVRDIETILQNNQYTSVQF